MSLRYRGDGELAGARVEFYAGQAQAANTRRAYASDFRQFQAWCEAQGFGEALPASSGAVSLYLAHLADGDKKVASIERALVAIRAAHRQAVQLDPTDHEGVKQILKGIRRQLGSSPKRAAPLLTDRIKTIVSFMNLNQARDLRDRALLCLGFAMGSRRSELVALDVEDLTFSEQGLTVCLRRSKTDQEGTGRNLVVFRGANGTCPVQALKAWLERAAIWSGAVFVRVDRWGHPRPGQRLTDQVVRLVVKDRARRAGLDAQNLSGHSLRAGLATQAALNGAHARDIAKQTGHRSEKILNGYIREADLWKNNVTAGLGL